MSIDRSQRITFEAVADIYNEARPRYPDAVFDDLIRLSGIPPGGRILEIGPGPGVATLPLARRGYQILAIELGERLAALAAKACLPYPKVQILQKTFEEWEVEEDAFDLVMAADAFHWIEPELGYPKAAQALKPAGSALFFWTLSVDPDTPWSREIDELYQAIDPKLQNPDKGVTLDWLTPIIEANFANSGCFGPVTVRQHRWMETLTTDQIIKRLQTYSVHSTMAQGVRRRLYAGIQEILDGAGGQVERTSVVALFHARVKP